MLFKWKLQDFTTLKKLLCSTCDLEFETAVSRITDISVACL